MILTIIITCIAFLYLAIDRKQIFEIQFNDINKKN